MSRDPFKKSPIHEIAKKFINHMNRKGTNYVFVRRFSEKLVGTESRAYGRNMWDLVTLRKDCKCEQNGRLMKKGELAWSPVTNGYNRMHRISPEAMKELEEKCLKAQATTLKET